MIGLTAIFSAFRAVRWLAWLYDNRAWLRWIVAGAAMAGLVGLWRWERHDRLAAARMEQAALRETALARADAARWQAAAAQRDQALALQTAAIERLRFDAARAESAAHKASIQSRAAAVAASLRIRELEEEAHARPEDVRPLGPIVLRRVGRLFE